MQIFKKQIVTALAFFGLSLVISAQSTLQYVPADVPFLLTFNLDQLNKKVSLDELRKYDFYQGLLKELRNRTESETDKEYMKKFMATPSAVGFDMLQPFHFFMQVEGDITYYALVMKMGDRTKYETEFQAYRADQYLENLTDHGNFKSWSNNAEMYAWNNEVILNVWAEKKYSYGDWGYTEPEDNYSNDWPIEEVIVYDDTPIEETPREDIIYMEEALPGPEEVIVFDIDTILPPPDLVEEYPTDEAYDHSDYNPWGNDNYDNWDPAEKQASLAAFAQKIMEKQSPAFLASNAKYRAAVSAKRPDVHFWMDYAYLFNQMQDDPSLAMMGGTTAMMMQSMKGLFDVFYAKSYFSIGMDFENGKMAMNTEYFPTDDLRRFYNAATDAKLNKKLLKYVEGGDKLFGYYFFNMSVKKSIEEGKVLMDKAMSAVPEYGLMASDAMKIAGIFIDEDAIADLLKGDMLMAVSGLKMMETKDRIIDYDDDFNMNIRDTFVIKEMPVVTLLASYGNQKDIQKFINLGIHSKVLEPAGKFYKMEIPEMGNAYLALQKGVMIFTNDYNLVAHKLGSGYKGKKRLGKEHRKRLCKNASAVYWDIPVTMYAISGEASTAGDPMAGYLDMFAKQFDSLVMTSPKKAENSIKAAYDFNFVNKGTNSLEQFFNFVNDIYIELLGGAKI